MTICDSAKGSPQEASQVPEGGRLCSTCIVNADNCHCPREDR